MDCFCWNPRQTLPLRYIEVIFGFVVLAGLYIIFAFDSNYAAGLTLGVVSGFTCAIFSVVNSLMVKRISSHAITLYEMIGAAILISGFIPCYAYFTGEHPGIPALPVGWDWLWILLLGGLCTVYAYSAAVELMKRISVFFFQLTLNLEPIYGIIMAMLVLEIRKEWTSTYLGTFIILLFRADLSLYQATVYNHPDQHHASVNSPDKDTSWSNRANTVAPDPPHGCIPPRFVTSFLDGCDYGISKTDGSKSFCSLSFHTETDV